MKTQSEWRDGGQTIARRYPRYLRIIVLRDLLREPLWRSVPDMAQRLNVDKRTIQRDLAALRSAPLYEPIIDDGEYRYRSIAR